MTRLRRLAAALFAVVALFVCGVLITVDLCVRALTGKEMS